MSGEKGIDWPGLLKWSLQYSDGTHETTPMSLERLRFLEAAIKEAMSMYEDPNDVVRESVNKMKEEGVNDGDVLNALQLIERCVDEAPEISRNLDKLGALEVLIEKISDPNPNIVEAVLQILSFAFPHNPQIQKKAWKLNCLAVLMDQEKCVESPSRFGALSGLMRHDQEIEKDFIKQGGWDIIASGLTSVNVKVQIKAANLLRHLFDENSLPPELALKSNIGGSLATMIDMPIGEHGERGVQYGETACSAVIATLNGCCNLVKSEPEVVAAQLLELRDALQHRLNYISSSKTPGHEQEQAMINEALQLIEQGSNSVAASTPARPNNDKPSSAASQLPQLPSP